MSTERGGLPGRGFAPGTLLGRLIPTPDDADGAVHARLDAAFLWIGLPGLGRSVDPERLAPGTPMDQVADVLARRLGRVLSVVVAHGGEVLKHRGDGLLALWPAESGDLGRAALRGTRCALALVAGRGDAEQVQCGLGAGTLWFARVGGHRNRWEILALGPALEQVARAKRWIPPGGVALSGEARTLLGDQVSGVALAGSRFLVQGLSAELGGLEESTDPGPLGPDWDAVLAGHVKAPVAVRLERGETDWEAEIRRVTVVHLRVGGIDGADPAVGERLQEPSEALQRELYRRGGVLERVIAGPDHLALVALFGLPPISAELRPSRAVHFALAARERLALLGLSVSTGLATGRLLLAPVGSPRRRLLVVLGQPLRRAERLSEARTGEVVCDQQTWRGAWSGLVYEDLEEQHFPDLKGPIPAWRVVEVDTPVSGEYPSPRGQHLVGRDREVGLVTRLLEDLGRDRPGVAVIEGHPGVGKSRLAALFLQRGRSLGYAVFAGNADPVGGAGPWGAWQPILRELLGIHPADSPEVRRRRIRERLARGQDRTPLAPLLNPLTGAEAGDTGETRRLDGAARADATDDLVTALLQEEAGHEPLVLVLEDGHWMDSASWRLALRFAREVRPSLLVLTTRVDVEPESPDHYRLLGLKWVTRVRLRGLSSEQTGALVARCLGVKEVPDHLAAYAWRTTQGNPYFTQELVYALWERGLLTVEDGRLAGAPAEGELEELALPATVEDVVLSRIDRLAPRERQVLEAASVIGPVFAREVVGALVAELADSAVKEALGELERVGLAHPHPVAPGPAYAFTHRITLEVVYQRIGGERRRALHRRLAERIEDREADNLDAWVDQLAHHWDQAGVDERLLVYTDLAGTRALRQGSHQEAARYFRRSLGLAAEGGDDASKLVRARLYRQLADALFGLGKVSGSAEHATQALVLVGRRVPSTLAGWRLTYLRQLLQQVLHLVAPDGLVRAAEPRRARFAEAARAAERLSETTYFGSDPVHLVATALMSANLAERAGWAVGAARSYGMLGMVAGFSRLGRLARRYFRRAQELAEESGDLAALALRYYAEATWRLGTGQWGRTDASLKLALEIARSAGERQEVEVIRTLLASARLALGRLEEARIQSEELLESARDRSNAQHQVWSLNLLGQTLIYLGRFEEAVWRLEAARELCAEADLPSEINCHGLLAQARMRRGEYREALRMAEAATLRIRRAPPIVFAIHAGMCGVAEVTLSAWSRALRNKEPAAAAQHQDQARAAIRDLKIYARLFPIGRPRSLLFEGRAAWLARRPERARRLAGQGLAAAEALGVPFDEALARYDLARMAEDDLTRREHQGAARELFQRMGCAWYLDELGG